MNAISERIKRLVKRLQFRKKREDTHDLDHKLVMSLKTSRLPNWTQLKRISLLLSSKEKRVVSSFAGIILISVGAWAYIYYRDNITILPAEGGVWSEALIGQPTFINPILAQTSDTDLDITRLIYRGLLTYDKDLKLTTDLAESYEIDEAQTKYTVVLKENIFWQDGVAVTVDDVIFTLRAIQDPNWESPLLVSFKGVTIDKIDERTIVFNLPERFGPFLSLLTTGLLPKHVWEEIPAASSRLAEFNIKPVGNGPWQFEEFSKDKSGTIHSYVLVPNDYFSEMDPYLSKITFKFYPDFTFALEALNQKQVMGVSFLPTSLQGGISEPENYSFNRLSLPQYTALFFNQKQNEFLKSKSVRTALANAIDKSKLTKEILSDQAKVLSSPILALESEGATTTLSFDPGRSIKLLEDVDWILNESGYREKDGEVLSITLTTLNHPENENVANFIKESWKKIGVQTTVQLIPQSEIQTNVIKNRDYDVLLYGAIVGADPDPYSFWHSSQVEHPGLNLSLFRDGNTDLLLEKAREELDAEKRLDSYEAFKRILLEEVPAVFLYTPTYTYIQEKRLQGFDIDGLIIPADRLNNSTDWYTKTRRSLK